MGPTDAADLSNSHLTLAKSGGQAGLTRSGSEIGALKCNVKGCVSFVFGSTRDINADGCGVGANALIDDFDKSVGLRPLSVEGVRGLEPHSRHSPVEVALQSAAVSNCLEKAAKAVCDDLAYSAP
jgi:hypothetical protein